jgi:hypothetical protein
MLEFVRTTAGARKLRLFACACCRRVGDLLACESSRQAVAAAELFADGNLRPIDLEVAHAAARWDAAGAGLAADYAIVDTAAFDAAAAAARAAADTAAFELDAAAVARQAVQAGGVAAEQADLLRDLLGNPFRQAPADPAWLAWREGTIACLAQAIYDSQTCARLPVLADALEEAGCTDVDVLGHCRVPGPHARGCWVVDLLLGKS